MDILSFKKIDEFAGTSQKCCGIIIIMFLEEF